MIRTRLIDRRIYDALYGLCLPFECQSPWISLVVDGNVRKPPPDAARALAHLKEQFSETQLVDSGVARKATDGALVLTQGLSTGSRPVVFLRPNPSGPPVDVLTATGCLSDRHLPMIAALSDFRTRQDLVENEGLLGAFSIEDVVILRALGFPATLAHGLECLDRLQFHTLSAHFGWTRARWARRMTERCGPEQHSVCPDFGGDNNTSMPPDNSSPPDSKAARSETSEGVSGPRESDNRVASSQSVNVSAGTVASKKGVLDRWLDGLEANRSAGAKTTAVILVVWSISELSLVEPPSFAAIRTQLRELQNHLDVMDMDVAVWTSSDDLLAKLKINLRYEPLNVCADDLRADIEESAGDLMYDSIDNPDRPRPATSYVEAQETFRMLLQNERPGTCDQVGLHAAWQEVQKWLEIEVIDPMFSVARQPRKRSLQLLAAEISRLLHRVTLLMGAGMSRVPVENLIQATEFFSGTKVKQLSSLIRNLLTLQRELRR